jgi:hypothetical protein
MLTYFRLAPCSPPRFTALGALSIAGGDASQLLIAYVRCIHRLVQVVHHEANGTTTSSKSNDGTATSYKVCTGGFIDVGQSRGGFACKLNSFCLPAAYRRAPAMEPAAHVPSLSSQCQTQDRSEKGGRRSHQGQHSVEQWPMKAKRRVKLRLRRSVVQLRAPMWVVDSTDPAPDLLHPPS